MYYIGIVIYDKHYLSVIVIATDRLSGIFHTAYHEWAPGTAAGILALSSCVDDAIAPLTGKYEKPVVYEMNTLVSQSVEKGEKTRTFTVELANDEASLFMKFVGDKYYLNDAGYTAAPADAAKKGNYLVGNGGSTFTLDGQAIPVESGTLIVAQTELHLLKKFLTVRLKFPWRETIS